MVLAVVAVALLLGLVVGLGVYVMQQQQKQQAAGDSGQQAAAGVGQVWCAAPNVMCSTHRALVCAQQAKHTAPDVCATLNPQCVSHTHTQKRGGGRAAGGAGRDRRQLRQRRQQAAAAAVAQQLDSDDDAEV
jgi:hypothetical protein